MPLKKARRLPRRFNRPVSKETRRLVRRRHRPSGHRRWTDSLRRFHRRSVRILASWRRSLAHWLIGILIALLLIALGLVFFSPIIRVREIRVERMNTRLDVEGVQRMLSPFFDRHLLFLQAREVTQVLRQHMADIQEVVVRKDYPSQLTVRITLDPLFAKLIIMNPDEAESATGTGTHVDYLTEHGVYVVASAIDQQQELPIIEIVDWGVWPEAGTALLTPDFLKRMQETERALTEQFGHVITRHRAFVRAQEYHLQIDGDKELWFDSRAPLEEQLLRYRTFLRSVDLQSVTQYVDLRLSDRVIYK